MQQAASNPKGHLIAQSKMRSAIARRMTSSKQGAPHFYVTVIVDMDEALSRSRSGESAKVSLTAVIVRAASLALRTFPRFGAVWTPDGLLETGSINVGVAIAVDDGLVAPALMQSDMLSLAETDAALRGLVDRARGGTLRADEAAEATFTVSNLGMLDVRSFAAIINPPQVAILATGACFSELRFVEGAVVEAQVMAMTLSADHRAVDGVDAAGFLGLVKRYLEDPPSIENAAREGDS
jgi:pyruvate dehydrogenase E2 component (dihydrolipoamide acetyltransferase)